MSLGRSLLGVGLVAAMVTVNCAKAGDDLFAGDSEGGTTTCGSCGGSAPLCDSASQKCVQCLADGDCDGGKCDPVSKTCKAGCTKDADCTDPSAKKCDTSTHTCAPCLTTLDTCPASSYCNKATDGTLSCKAGCKTVMDCNAFDAGAPQDGGSAAMIACCNHTCSDTTADIKNCAMCGNACGAGAACCSSACTDIQGTIASCGGCGNLCSPQNVVTAQCKMGSCGYDSCTMGFGDCDSNTANGCETDTTGDTANCGKCGNACKSGETCVGGACIACTTNEVASAGHCYYLDGSSGNCDAGYSRASEATLTSIASSFVGKNYKHTISSNCCVWTSDATENYGMLNHCNTNGPFTAGDPKLGAIGCTGATNHNSGQLTFCGK